MTRGRSLILGSVLVLAVGAGPVEAQSPAPTASPGLTASPGPTGSLEPAAGPIGMPWVTTISVPATGAAPGPRDVTAWSGGFA